jgi:two-component system, LytTR family, response regulator
MIRALIVDDEPKAVKNTTALLKLFSNVEVVGFANSAEVARQVMINAQPNLILLDINMPEENGFDFLESLPNRNFQVIFITAHHGYALKALRANALDYLQKPIDIDELSNAIKKVEMVIGTQQTSKDNVQLNNLAEALQKLNKKEELDKMAIPYQGGFKILEFNDIMYFQGEGNYSTIHLQNFEKLTITRQLGYFEDILPKSIFFRIHKSSIVNLNYITGYSNSNGNTAILKDGNLLSISRRRLNDFLSKFQDIST